MAMQNKETTYLVVTNMKVRIYKNKFTRILYCRGKLNGRELLKN
jgi:hypothetical protein